jgi:hypothetical protein
MGQSQTFAECVGRASRYGPRELIFLWLWAFTLEPPRNTRLGSAGAGAHVGVGGVQPVHVREQETVVRADQRRHLVGAARDGIGARVEPGLGFRFTERAAEHGHPTGRERMVSPTLQTHQ